MKLRLTIKGGFVKKSNKAINKVKYKLTLKKKIKFSKIYSYLCSYIFNIFKPSGWPKCTNKIFNYLKVLKFLGNYLILIKKRFNVLKFINIKFEYLFNYQSQNLFFYTLTKLSDINISRYRGLEDRFRFKKPIKIFKNSSFIRYTNLYFLNFRLKFYGFFYTHTTLLLSSNSKRLIYRIKRYLGDFGQIPFHNRAIFKKVKNNFFKKNIFKKLEYRFFQQNASIDHSEKYNKSLSFGFSYLDKLKKKNNSLDLNFVRTERIRFHNKFFVV